MIARYSISVLVGLLITLSLFYLMQALVVTDRVTLSDVQTIRFVDVVQAERRQEAKIEDRQVEKPVPPEAPPPDLDIPTAVANNTGQRLSFGQLSLDTGLTASGPALGAPTDGDYLPLVRIQPEYPRRALERGVEGFVVVELTVTEEGSVENVKVVEADPPGYFERAAEQAAMRFKYKPKVVNGEPVPVEGVRYLFSFNLDDDGGRRR